jgi:hypothetical protein
MLFKETALAESFTKSTAFRNNRAAELVTITQSSFEGCRLLSKARFEVGERLRLHIPGQGLIEAQVQWISGSTSGVTFLNECNV